MSPESEALWRELLKRAGPCFAALAVDASKCCEAVGIALDSAQPALAELLNFGAVTSLTADELKQLAGRKKLVGDFILWGGGASSQFLRVADPDDIRLVMLAKIETLRREDVDLMRRYESRLRSEPTDSKLRWSKMLTGQSEAIREQAEVFWNARTISPNVDPALTPNVGRRFLESLFQVATTPDSVLTEICERRNQVATKLARLVADLPKWTRQSSDKEVCREQIPKAAQQEVWPRDQGRCVECGSKEKLEFDHIIPVSKGGATTVRNLQLLCEPCNRGKSNRI